MLASLAKYHKKFPFKKLSSEAKFVDRFLLLLHIRYGNVKNLFLYLQVICDKDLHVFVEI